MVTIFVTNNKDTQLVVDKTVTGKLIVSIVDKKLEARSVEIDKEGAKELAKLILEESTW